MKKFLLSLTLILTCSLYAPVDVERPEEPDKPTTDQSPIAQQPASPSPGELEGKNEEQGQPESSAKKGIAFSPELVDQLNNRYMTPDGRVALLTTLSPDGLRDLIISDSSTFLKSITSDLFSKFDADQLSGINTGLDKIRFGTRSRDQYFTLADSITKAFVTTDQQTKKALSDVANTVLGKFVGEFFNITPSATISDSQRDAFVNLVKLLTENPAVPTRAIIEQLVGTMNGKIKSLRSTRPTELANQIPAIDLLAKTMSNIDSKILAQSTDILQKNIQNAFDTVVQNYPDAALDMFNDISKNLAAARKINPSNPNLQRLNNSLTNAVKSPWHSILTWLMAKYTSQPFSFSSLKNDWNLYWQSYKSISPQALLVPSFPAWVDKASINNVADAKDVFNLSHLNESQLKNPTTTDFTYIISQVKDSITFNNWLESKRDPEHEIKPMMQTAVGILEEQYPNLEKVFDLVPL